MQTVHESTNTRIKGKNIEMSNKYFIHGSWYLLSYSVISITSPLSVFMYPYLSGSYELRYIGFT